MLNDCLLKRAAVLNYSHDRRFVVAGKCPGRVFESHLLSK